MRSKKLYTFTFRLLPEVRQSSGNVKIYNFWWYLVNFNSNRNFCGIKILVF